MYMKYMLCLHTFIYTCSEKIYARSKFPLELKMMDILGRLLNVLSTLYLRLLNILSTLYLRLKRSVYVLYSEG